MRIELVLTFLAMTAVTFLTRSLFTVSVSSLRISPFWERFLSFIPFAVLTAMVTPYLLLPEGAGSVTAVNPYFVAGAATFLLSWRSRSLILSVAVGMLLFLGMGWV